MAALSEPNSHRQQSQFAVRAQSKSARLRRSLVAVPIAPASPG
jgi:hypothetical protein